MKTLKSILFSLLAMMAVAVFMTSCEQESPLDEHIVNQDDYFHIKNADGSVAKNIEPELVEPIYEHMISIGMEEEAEKFIMTYTEKGELIPKISELNFDGRNTVSAQSNLTERAILGYGTHVQGMGWDNGNFASVDTGTYTYSDSYRLGTIGQSRRLEAYYLQLYGYNLCYQSHIQGIGWQSTKCNGSVTGTTGQSKRMEATRIWLNGGGFVKYKAHVQGIGWQSWRYNGAVAGTTGQSRRIEALEVKFYLY